MCELSLEVRRSHRQKEFGCYQLETESSLKFEDTEYPREPSPISQTKAFIFLPKLPLPQPQGVNDSLIITAMT